MKRNVLVRGILGGVVWLAFLTPLEAQTKQWTLEECIRYAIEHNIDLKQQEQQRELSEIAANTSKNSWLPNLNASVGQNFSFGRIQSADGTISSRNGSNTSFGAQIQMPVFSGLRIPNDIAAKKLNLQASMASLEKAKEDLAINITSYYVQVLYNKEMLKIAQLQVELAHEQVLRTEALVNAGKVPLSQLYDIKAQLAKDEVSMTEARNNVNLALLDLKQGLELERESTGFEIQTPLLDDAVGTYMGSILPPENIYNNAVVVKPQIREQALLLESQKKQLKVAQADYFPQLSLSAGYSSGYYFFYSGLMGSEVNRSFSKQFSDNSQEMIGLSLSIPIFNRFQVRNNVRSARVNIVNRELLMENSKKVLYKEIQQAYFNAVAAQEKYTSSEKSVLASKEAFSYAEERYAAGKSTVFEYNESKTKYAQSLSEQVQAKYDFIFRAKILDFYNGTPITL
ncbi:MAG: TolC family protein [Tannerellaceae bacterium]|jgi:outer membrane protein|nr:TolC family protein [Tannerellaceae bacterium]